MPLTDLVKRLGLEVPLIVAPMAGGPSSPELVIASSESGALGSLGAAYSSASAIEALAHEVRSKTQRPFAINLFIPEGAVEVSAAEFSGALRATETYRAELGLPPPTLAPPYEENFDEQFAAVLRVKPAALSFVFGLLGPEYVRSARREAIFLIGTATSLDEARALEESGVDAITLQGIEAGGHRGIFDSHAADPEIGLFDLLDRCRAKVKIPLVAAGGLMTSEDIRAALSKGAQAVQMGTAFLACREAGTSAPYREALVARAERKTKTTRVFSGRWARGLENRFLVEMEKKPEAILPFPAQNKFTRDLRTASAKKGESDFLSLWCGTGSGELWTGSASDLIATLF